jgi:hypothetical protein
LPLSRYRQVVIFCPVAVTGGPEAIHQLSHSLHAIGVDCWIVHAGQGHLTRMGGDHLEVLAAPNAHMTRAFAAYGPRYSPRIVLDERTLVILPEWFAQHAIGLAHPSVAIWWLSVDNAFQAIGSSGADAIIDQVLARPDLIHLHQSAYARDWLRGRGIERLHDLGDYTSPLFTGAPAKAAPSPLALVSYNGAKGGEIAQAFFAERPQLDALALSGFSKLELQAIFHERLLYVDFGHFPGKDRLPREAAVSGGVVFVHRKGAAATYEDFALPDFYKFEEADLASRELGRRLDAVVADPSSHWARQAQFRSLVAWEKAAFHDQVMRLWGVRRML